MHPGGHPVSWMSAQGPEASPKVASPVNFRNNFGNYSPGSIRSVQSSLTTLGPVSTPARLLPAPARSWRLPGDFAGTALYFP